MTQIQWILLLFFNKEKRREIQALFVILLVAKQALNKGLAPSAAKPKPSLT